MAVDAGHELVEVVDDQGRVLEVVTRARMRAERLMHRAVYVLVRDETGRVLIHRRSEDKDLWPGRWDVAIGGVMAVGESWSAGAVRELAEEIGVEVDPADLDDLGAGVYEDDDVAVVGHCFAVCHEGPFGFADGEVTEAMFVDAAELARRRDRDPFLPDSWALLAPWLPVSG